MRIVWCRPGTLNWKSLCWQLKSKGICGNQMGCLRLVPDVRLINVGGRAASSQATWVHRFPGNNPGGCGIRDICADTEQMPGLLYQLSRMSRKLWTLLGYKPKHIKIFSHFLCLFHYINISISVLRSPTKEGPSEKKHNAELGWSHSTFI